MKFICHRIESERFVICVVIRADLEEPQAQVQNSFHRSGVGAIPIHHREPAQAGFPSNVMGMEIVAVRD
jgi:hypothetical protein